MNENLVKWWGFRLRFPLDYDPEPLNRREALSFWLLFATALETLWLAFLILFRPELDGQYFRFLREDLLYPILFTAIPVVIAILLPPSILTHLKIGPWVVLAREKGTLRSWDLLIVLLAILVAVMGFIRIAQPEWVASHHIVCLIVLVDVVLASLALAFLQARVDFSLRRWKIPVPDWLEETEEDKIRDPDPDSENVYDFEVDSGTSYRVGIRIPPEVLAELRRINTEHEGRLYQKEPEAVVLVDRPPAEDVGRSELVRFCNQLLAIVKKHAHTPYTACNLVLFFVQKSIRYEFDEDSTSDIPGGPYLEYGRFALETYNDQVGDCECTALYCASLLAYMGFNTALLHVSVPASDDGHLVPHLAVGIEIGDVMGSDELSIASFDSIPATDGSGRRYLYGESAVDGATLAFGGIPPEWKARIETHGVEPIPLP